MAASASAPVAFLAKGSGMACILVIASSIKAFTSVSVDGSMVAM